MLNKKFILVLSFLTLILASLLPSASAACIEVKLSKQIYLSGETLQAEITGNPSKPLTIDNLRFFQDNKEYFPAFNLEQAAKDKWILWTNLPKNYGNSELRTAALCKDQVLQEITVSSAFQIIRPLNDAYSSLINEINKGWQFLDEEETALALTALSYNPSIRDSGRMSLLSKSIQQECWPSDTLQCDIKSTSLAFSALKNSAYSEKIKNWLLDSENNVNLGLWDLIVQSNSSQSCNLEINGQIQSISVNQGSNSPKPLTLPDTSEINLSINCPLLSAKVSHTHLGKVNDFPLSLVNGKLSLRLNNQKCWGKTYRSDCDATSTAHAINSLKELGAEVSLQKEIIWLGQNVLTTEEKALYYKFTGDSSTDTWLTNNQAPEGYWSKNSLAISNALDVSATVYSLLALNQNKRQKGEQWLKDKFEKEGSFGNLKENALALQLFAANQIEPLLSIKGFEKAKSKQNLTLTFSNVGTVNISLSAQLFGSSRQASIAPLSEAELTFEAPEYKEFTFNSAEIYYSTVLSQTPRSYSIPVLILPSSAKENEISNIINSTSAGVSLFPADLQFTSNLVNQSLIIGRLNTVRVIITNPSSKAKNVSISVQGLYELLEKINPANFELTPNQSKEVSITLDATKAFGEYSGNINAESSGISLSLPVHLTSILISKTNEKICSELNGKVCEQDQICDSETVSSKEGNCCIGICSKPTEVRTEAKTNYKKMAGWIMLILAVLISGSFVYFKLRKKPKPGLRSTLEKLRETSREPGFSNPSSPSSSTTTTAI